MQQLSTPQLKTREQAEEYLKIEQNTQFLTHLLRYTSNKRRVYINPEAPSELRSIASLVVQFSYLLFTCCVKQVNILVSKKFILMNPNKKQHVPQICCQYMLEKDYNQLKPQQQRIVVKDFQLHQFSMMQPQLYGKYVMYYIDMLMGMARRQFDRLKLPVDKMLAKQFINLDNIKNFLIPVIQSIEHPRIVILSFQQSQIFREYSILVKVMNNSIFSTIKNSKNKGIFNQICQLEHKLTKKKLNGKSYTHNFSLEIEETIEDFLRYLIKIQIIFVEQSISNSQKSQGSRKKGAQEQIPKAFNQNAKQYVLGQIEQTSIQQRLYKCRIHVGQKPWRPFNAQLFQNLKFQALNNYNRVQTEQEGKEGKPPQKQNQSQIKNEFIVEFIAAKGLLIVKYITPIELNIENTDLVMFQCNNIAYHWSNVNMELVQKSPNKMSKKKERYLSLKTIAHLNISDRPLFKLLLMLDLVMLCAKIAEPELKRSIIRVQDYYRIEEISSKVNHMINLFIRKIEKYYKMISDSQTANLN